MIHYTKTIALLATMFLGLSISVAQDYSKPDSAVYDPYATDTASSFLESGKSSEATQPVRKPYIRFVTPFDTITELVTYADIINEQIVFLRINL